MGLAALFIFAVVVFIMLIFTILALIALFRPIRIGSFSLSSEEAERFLLWSMAGAFVVPIFALFCEWFFVFQIRDNLWFYIVVGGYVLGAMAMIANEEEVQKQQQAAASRPLPSPPPAPVRPQGLPRPQAQPFRFASWDDEERRR